MQLIADGRDKNGKGGGVRNRPIRSLRQKRGGGLGEGAEKRKSRDQGREDIIKSLIIIYIYI